MKRVTQTVIPQEAMMFPQRFASRVDFIDWIREQVELARQSVLMYSTAASKEGFTSQAAQLAEGAERNFIYFKHELVKQLVLADVEEGYSQ